MSISKEVASLLTSRRPGGAVLNALATLFTNDAYLLAVDANERSICHRFAMYLQAEIPKLHVDCEYNRDGVDPKRIAHFDLDVDDEDTEATTVFPDVIVHIRGTQDENYLVVEFKKSTNKVPKHVDYAKLHGYKRDLRYKFALYVELAVGKGASVATVEWID